jgi:hypothetical protein
MAIAFANLGVNTTPDINPSAVQSSYATASWTPPTSGLILLSVYSVKVGGSDLPTVSGNSLTWVQIATHVNVNWRQTLFAANASGSTTGATTISFGGVNQLRCLAAFSHATGVDLSGTVAAAFVQSVAETDLTTSAPSITLAAASNSANRPYACFSNGISDAITPRTNWTELDDFLTLDGGRIETQFRSDAFETTASASGSTTNWEGIAVELKAAGAFQDLASVSGGSATVAGIMSVDRGLAGTSAGAATTAGDATRLIGVAGASAGIATVTPTATVEVSLAGSSAGVATAAASLGRDLALAGTSAGAAIVSGLLTLPSEDTAYVFDPVAFVTGGGVISFK